MLQPPLVLTKSEPPGTLNTVDFYLEIIWLLTGVFFLFLSPFSVNERDHLLKRLGRKTPPSLFRAHSVQQSVSRK